MLLRRLTSASLGKGKERKRGKYSYVGGEVVWGLSYLKFIKKKKGKRRKLENLSGKERKGKKRLSRSNGCEEDGKKRKRMLKKLRGRRENENERCLGEG